MNKQDSNQSQEIVNLFDLLNKLIFTLHKLNKKTQKEALRSILKLIHSGCPGMNEKCDLVRKIRILAKKPYLNHIEFVALLATPEPADEKISELLECLNRYKLFRDAPLKFFSEEQNNCHLDDNDCLSKLGLASYVQEEKLRNETLWIKKEKERLKREESARNKEIERVTETIRSHLQSFEFNSADTLAKAHASLIQESFNYEEERKTYLLKYESQKANIELIRNDQEISLARQIELFDTLEKLTEVCKRNNVPNRKLNQLQNLLQLQESIQSSDEEYNHSVATILNTGHGLSKSKTVQLEKRIELANASLSGSNDQKWAWLNIWFYTASEWLVEDWAETNSLTVHDYNNNSLFHPSDLKISNIDVDVKTTMGVGRRHLTVYYSHQSRTPKEEVIVGVKSLTQFLDSGESTHVIQGVFDPNRYKVPVGSLKHFPIHKNLLNPCFFQPIDKFFKIDRYEGITIPDFDRDVIEFSVEREEVRQAAFFVLQRQGGFEKVFLDKVLPSENHDFIPTLIHLAANDSISLLPHYFADYLVELILRKKPIDDLFFEKILSIVYFSEDQKEYLYNLYFLSHTLDIVRCKFHPDETISDMDIEFYKGPNPTFAARCCQDPSYRTTIMSYSWRTGETLIYGENEVRTCDSETCGCLVHRHDHETIGKRSCDKYGEKGSHRFVKNELFR